MEARGRRCIGAAIGACARWLRRVRIGQARTSECGRARRRSNATRRRPGLRAVPAQGITIPANLDRAELQRRRHHLDDARTLLSERGLRVETLQLRGDPAAVPVGDRALLDPSRSRLKADSGTGSRSARGRFTRRGMQASPRKRWWPHPMVSTVLLSNAVGVQRTRRQASLVQATQTALRQRRRRRTDNALAGSLAIVAAASDPEALARWEHEGGAVDELDRQATRRAESGEPEHRMASSVVASPFS